MKEIKLNISEPLPDRILRGEKDTTWRVTDYHVHVGDVLVLCHNDGREFGRAQVRWMKETIFGELTAEDKQGHEQFSSDEELYVTYSRYYKTQITPQTRVFVVKFKLLKN